MQHRTERPDRNGYILVAVLWVLAAVSAFGLQLSLTAHEQLAGARNRIDLTRAAWHAEDCLERTRALIHAHLNRPDQPHGWGSLDLLDLHTVLPPAGLCDVLVQPAGVTLNVNAATEEQLSALFRALGASDPAADSIAAAVLDWIDPDDRERELGAERAWYRSRGRTEPRNGAVANVRELHFVRGLEHSQRLEAVLGIEPGRIPISHAQPAVLQALPGLSNEAVARILEIRRQPEGVVSLATIASEISEPAAALLRQRFGELMPMTMTEPDAWLVTSRAAVGAPPVTAVVEVRLLRADRRAAVVRRRTWTE